MRKVTLIALTVLLVVTGIAAGRRQEQLPVDQNGRLVITPEMKERMRARRELLETPGNLVFKVTPKTDGDREGGMPRGDEARNRQFKVGSDMSFEVAVTSKLNEPVTVPLPETYESFRPQLFKGAELIPYSDRAARVLESRKTFWATTNSRSTSLAPGQTQTLGFFNFKAWYGPLKPGGYRLLLKYNLAPGMNAFELPQVEFEVIP
jgi:hypothetical protein